MTIDEEIESKCLNDLWFPYPLTEAYYEVSKPFHNNMILPYKEVQYSQPIIEVIGNIRKLNDDEHDINLFFTL